MPKNPKRETIAISALRRIERRLVAAEKRGTATGKRKPAKAALIGIRNCVRLATPEPDVLRAIGEESQRKGTDKLTSRQIDRLVKAARTRKTKLA